MPPLTTRQRRILAVVATDSTYEPRVVGGADARLVPSTKEVVWVGKCIFCGRALSIAADGVPISRATLEHIWPRNHGGTDALENLALACASCNHEKGVRHDQRRRMDPKLAEICGALAEKRKARWREPVAALAEHVRWVRARET
jgi:5-methylcytosine-specific restriction endonuclease McrA